MPVFAYTALNPQGRTTSGVITAPTRPAAIDQVVNQGLHPVDIEERAAKPQATRISFGRGGRISPAQVEAFTREMANLLGAGVSLSRALQLLARESANPAAKKLWSTVRDDVMDGASLADAMARHGHVFTPVNVAMVRAGETGGFLDVVLEQIADFRAREADLKGKVKAAMIYPTILSILMVCVVVFLLIYFIPRFEGIFREFGESLPALTQAIVTVSYTVKEYGLIVAGAIVVAIVAIRRAATTDAGRRTIDHTLLRTPAIGVVLARFALVRFARMLGTLVGAGVPLVTALRVAREAIGNQTLSDAVDQAIDQVQAGEPLARSLSECSLLFPASVVEMIAVAEETGRLDKELIRMAGTYENDLDRRLRMLVATAEPALLFIMAAVVGTIVVGMLLPVFTLQDLIK